MGDATREKLWTLVDDALHDSLGPADLDWVTAVDAVLDALGVEQVGVAEHADEIVLPSRATALSPTELLRLDQWAESLTWTFDPGPYLVGSALTRRDYRDVDVRVRLEDSDPLINNPDRLRIVNVALSVWAQQASGLPVDFQFQHAGEWDAETGPRNPLGSRWRTVHRAAHSARPEEAPRG